MKVAAYLCSLTGVLVLVLFCALPGSSGPLSHDAYVWQRQWRPEVGIAIQQNSDVVHAWHVLFAQIDANGSLRRVHPDVPALLASQRPVIAVVRIETQSGHFDANALREHILGLLSEIQAANIPLAGIEVDHDCARSQLPRYANFLAQLKQKLPFHLPLSATTLPDWLESPALPTLLSQLDESVLQVHAVTNPRTGLFDAAQAETWASRYAAITPRPFRVAVPNYGTQLRFDAHGNLIGVQSETPLLGQAAHIRELIVPPAQVQTLLQHLQHKPPRLFAGVVWFRLPVADDERGWHVGTWRAVITGRTLTQKLEITAHQQSDPQLFDILLRNPSDIDLETPTEIALPSDCQTADGLNGYDLVASAHAGMVLQRRQAGLFPPGQTRLIGWARCLLPPGNSLHVRS